ncbi:MAG: 4-hydroxy-3-methylbut-2-enyl diphosphate reductase [Gammaproteobacteria bacterium]|nr:4-hydroxy-3-methylbut-2-enyl diphosphate reductase [Gammaproteobacteria bacterium]
MKILLANPRGFCAGVDRAIEIVERAIQLFGTPIYVRHEVVHNIHVVERLRAMGTVFVQELNEVPDSSTVIFSAHGVSKAVADEGKSRNLRVFDATCPLVTKVHMEVRRYAQDARDVLLIGHQGHPEVEGTLGQFEGGTGGQIRLVETVSDALAITVTDPDRLVFVTQTTLSVDDTAAIVATLKVRFPKLESPRKEDICYATQNRQDAVKNLLRHCDLLIVVGSPTSSNSNRLVELGVRVGVDSFLVDGPADLQRDWLTGRSCIGVSAGASAPDILVQEVVVCLQQWGAEAPAELSGVSEHVVFTLPNELRIKPKGYPKPL